MKLHKKLYYIKLRSHDHRLIKSAVNLWFTAADHLNLQRSNLIDMPTKKSSIILLRSPHVYKKSREKFQFIRCRSMFIVYDSNSFEYQNKVKRFIDLLTEYQIPGISFQIIKMSSVKKI
jgi:ribosomal protein S10